jgi:hypothetical protein
VGRHSLCLLPLLLLRRPLLLLLTRRRRHLLYWPLLLHLRRCRLSLLLPLPCLRLRLVPHPPAFRLPAADLHADQRRRCRRLCRRQRGRPLRRCQVGVPPQLPGSCHAGLNGVAVLQLACRSQQLAGGPLADRHTHRAANNIHKPSLPLILQRSSQLFQLSDQACLRSPPAAF